MMEQVTQVLKNEHYVCTDVRTSKEVDLKFYDMCPPTGENASTAESLFQAVDCALKKMV